MFKHRGFPFERCSARLLFGFLIVAFAFVPVASTVKVPYDWLEKLDDPKLDRDGNHVEDEIDAMPSSAVVEVVLALNECASPSDLARLARFGEPTYQGKYVSTLALSGVAVGDAAALGADPQVAFVFLDRPAVEELQIANPAVKVRDSSVYTPNTVESRYPTLDGSGRVVAVLDNGVDDGVHESLPASKVVGTADCTVCSCGNCALCPCDPINPSDQSALGHGTHVAGIAVGAGGPAGAFRGIAPAAGLADIRVMGPNASVLTIQRGVEWAIAHKTQWGIDVLNMSLGIPGGSSGTDPVSETVNRAVDSGIVVVTSAGNDSAAYIKSPAAADDAIAVAASSYEGDIDRANDAVAAFSNRGPRWSDLDGIIEDERKPDITAPGTDFLPGDSNSSGIVSPDAGTTASYSRRWGTSMAAPLVAGCAALLKQANPALSPLAIKRLLLDSAQKRGTATGWDTAWGMGLLDCYQAVHNLQQTPKSDLGFDVYCGRPKNSPSDPDWWVSSDIQLANPVVEEKVPNTITVTVKNYSGTTASDILVRVGVYNFSNSDADYDICLLRVPSLAGGSQAQVSCPWTPKAGGSVTTYPTIHACLKAKVIYGFDSNGGNDCAQRNVLFANVASPHVFPVRVENDTEEPLEVVVETDWDGEASPWTVSLSETNFRLTPDECPHIVTVTMEPRPGTTEGFETVSVRFTGRTDTGETVDLGGVQTAHQFENDLDGRGAAFDCDDQDPTRWSVPGEAEGVSFDADKTTMRWQTPTETGGTQPVFYDVFRAKNGDGFDPAALSNVCIVVHQDGPVGVIDEIPRPGSAFYYAVLGSNGCGDGYLGRSTRGVERQVGSCP